MNFFNCQVFFTHTEETLMKLNELNAALVAIQGQLAKAKAEIIEKIAALEMALRDIDLPDEAQVALGALAATTLELDNLVPDVPPEPAA